MKKPPLSLIALGLSLIALLFLATTVPTLDISVREALATGRPCVVSLVLAIWGAILGACVASYVRPVPKMAWGAMAIAGLVAMVFLVLLHA